ncbi:hypothetical protein N7470_004429 [Penicillium chermesinum]|nr:hypothetical protein N7470_004429 [Penicillium chermesinum]
MTKGCSTPILFFKSPNISLDCQSDSTNCARNSRQCLSLRTTARRSTSTSSARSSTSSHLNILTDFLDRGVLVAKKDFNLPKHGDIDTKNLYVIKALQSLNSRGYVKTQFSWQYYYYTLTPEGLDYLREWLHLPAEVVLLPTSSSSALTLPPRGMLGGEERERRPRAPREGGYRRREEGKEGGAPGRFAPPSVVASAVAAVPPSSKGEAFSVLSSAASVFLGIDVPNARRRSRIPILGLC